MRNDVRKTYKLYIGGKFVRSESGQILEVLDHKGQFLANVSKASRKDVRDAVVAARSAQPQWASATAYNRGQILYRIAEMLEGRRDQFVNEIQISTGKTLKQATTEVERAIDSWVWHAGWPDKIDAVAGNMNPVAGPFFNISTLVPTGVVAAISPSSTSLVGLVNTIAPAIVSGNSVVVLANTDHPLPAATLSEVFETSDLPAGVVNLLTGLESELATWLATHQDVNAIDLEGVSKVSDLEIDAAINLKRVIRPGEFDRNNSIGNFQHICALMEVKTVWHPKGH